MPQSTDRPAASLGTKLTYLVIVLMWISAGLAVYFTFFHDRTDAQPNDRVVDTLDPANESEIGEADESAQKQLILDADGKPVDPQTIGQPVDLPDFELINQSGDVVTKQSLLGTPWVGTFVFTTCPGPCAMITGKMRMLQEDLKRDNVHLVSFTVNPETDTPERLTKYADAFSANLETWHFLTGDRSVIYSLIQKGFKMPVGEVKPGDIIHSNKFVVVDSKGFYVDDFEGLNEQEYGQLKKRLRQLAKEIDAAEPTIDPAK